VLVYTKLVKTVCRPLICNHTANIRLIAYRNTTTVSAVAFIRSAYHSKAITLRMTQEEFDFFQKQMQTAKPKTQTDFFLSVLRKKPIIVIEELKPTLQELKRQGNNLNQISRKLNETSSFGESATRVMNECWKVYRTLNGIEEVVKNAFIQRNSKQSET